MVSRTASFARQEIPISCCWGIEVPLERLTIVIIGFNAFCHFEQKLNNTQ